MGNATRCAVDGCESPLKRAGFCYGHYMKNWRYGTPTLTHPTRNAGLLGRRFGALLVIDRKDSKWICRCDCGATVRTGTSNLLTRGHSACQACSAKSRRQEVIGYHSAHSRIYRERGSADAQSCIDCGHTAQHWSYNHDDPDGLEEPMGSSVVAYSADPDHYSPRCVPCHKRFDLGRLNSA